MLLLVIGVLIAVWYFGFVGSARRLSSAANTKAAEIELNALSNFSAKYDADTISKLKETKALLSSL
jgi:hypothetical protein